MPLSSPTLFSSAVITAGDIPAATETGGGVVTPVPPVPRVVDDRLAISVEHADGRVTRWGPDEVKAANIPTDLTFGTSIPGGYGQMQCSLLRRLDQDHPDQDLFDTVTVYGPGGRIAYQGRMQQFPRSHGDTYQITPGAVGWSAHLNDDKSFREIYVDRDPASWHDPPLSRREAVAGSEDHARIDASSGSGGLTWQPPAESLAAGTSRELHYDIGAGLTIGRFQYRGTRTGTFTNFEAPTLHYSLSESLSGAGTSALTLDGNMHEVAADLRRYLMLRLYVSTLTTPGVGQFQEFTKVAVWGTHDLPGHSTGSGEPDGIFAYHIIENALDRAAPLLKWTDESMDSTTFPIPHAVYREPVSAQFIIEDVNKHHLFDWGVYGDREFFYRQPDPDRLTWEARLGDGAHMDADGLSGEPVINGVFVTYTDPLGVQKTVGPPDGIFDDTDPALEDASPDNPVNSHGIPAKWDPITLTFPATLASAVQIGAVYLAERSLATRRGSVTLTGLVQHPTEGKVPAWRVRAGDWIRITDLNGENATVQRKIIETSYSHQSVSVTCTLDNTPAQLEAILSRVGVLTGIQTGGGF